MEPQSVALPDPLAVNFVLSATPGGVLDPPVERFWAKRTEAAFLKVLGMRPPDAYLTPPAEYIERDSRSGNLKRFVTAQRNNISLFHSTPAGWRVTKRLTVG